MTIRKLLLAGVPPLCVMLVVLAGWSGSAVAAEACPNEQYREGASALLPECRAYEMVSPPYKAGYGATAIKSVAENGERVVFASPGAFGGSPTNTEFNGYLARRSVSGWSSVSVQPPPSIGPISPSLGDPIDVSPSAETSLTVVLPGPNAGTAGPGDTEEYFLHQSGAPESQAGFELAGLPLTPIPGYRLEEGAAYEGASANFSHLVFTAPEADPFVALAAQTQEPNLYDLTTGRNPSLRLVALNSAGELIDPYCEPNLGAGVGRLSKFNAISADGTEIFFSQATNRAEAKHCENGARSSGYVPSNPEILFLRVNGEKTLQVSAPVAADCVSGLCRSTPPARAEFDGANEAGTRVFFTTTQPLVTGDSDSSPNLYLARIGCPDGSEASCEPASREVTSMTQVSATMQAGEAADLQGVVSVAPDGTRVYFVARGVLSEAANAEGAVAVRGADNLYVYDASAKATSFIGDLCSGGGHSGTVAQGRCPEGAEASDAHQLWENTTGTEAQTAGADGRYLVFGTYARLLAGDADSARDIYRYDAQSGALTRISTGEDGYDANGNGDANTTIREATRPGGSSAAVAEDHGVADRAVSEDGSRIVFTTTEPLSPRATNGLLDVYEWHQSPGSVEGAVSLVSPGEAEQPVEPEKVVISTSGRDIFFVTSQGLVPQDTDGAEDIYDARVEGGFPPASAPQQPCAGDACQGPLSTPAPVLVPGSVSQAPGENFPGATETAPTKKKAKAKARKKPQKPRRHRAKHSGRKGTPSSNAGNAHKTKRAGQ